MGFTRPIGTAGFATSDVGDPTDSESGAPSAALVPFVQATTLPGAQDVLDDAMPFTDLASATTTAIGGVASNKVRITGTTTITGLGTIGTGIRRLVRFAAALTLTHHATALILPGSANITTAADDTAEFVSLGSGNWICLWYKRAASQPLAYGTTLQSQAMASSAVAVTPANLANLGVLKGLLNGLTLANDATDPTNDISFAAGSCANSTGAELITCAAMIKQLDVVWAAGTNAGGLDTGAIGDAVYHCFAIKKDSDGVGDFLFSTSATAPTMPSGYTVFRRVGSIIRSGATILGFVQVGDEFLKTVPSNPLATNNPGTSAVTVTPGTVPNGIVCWGIFDWLLSDLTPAAATHMLVTAIDQTDTAASITCFTFSTAAATAVVPARAGGRTVTRLNTSRQCRYRLDASTTDHTVYLVVVGWIDRRGRDG